MKSDLEFIEAVRAKQKKALVHRKALITKTLTASVSVMVCLALVILVYPTLSNFASKVSDNYAPEAADRYYSTDSKWDAECGDGGYNGSIFDDDSDSVIMPPADQIPESPEDEYHNYTDTSATLREFRYKGNTYYVSDEFAVISSSDGNVELYSSKLPDVPLLTTDPEYFIPAADCGELLFSEELPNGARIYKSDASSVYVLVFGDLTLYCKDTESLLLAASTLK